MSELRQMISTETDQLTYAKALLLETKLLVQFATLGSAMFVQSLLTKIGQARKIFAEVVSQESVYVARCELIHAQILCKAGSQMTPG